MVEAASKSGRAPAGENGGREDVRWVALSDGAGCGVAAVSLGGQAMHINVSRHASLPAVQPAVPYGVPWLSVLKH